MIRSSQGLNALRLWDQVSRNLLGLQQDMRMNALTWQASATAGSVPPWMLLPWMFDAAQTYRRRAQWVVDLRATDRWADVMAVGASYGVAEAEVVDMLEDVTDVAAAIVPAVEATKQWALVCQIGRQFGWSRDRVVAIAEKVSALGAGDDPAQIADALGVPPEQLSEVLVAVRALLAMPREYGAILGACAAILAEVPPLESLWPE